MGGGGEKQSGPGSHSQNSCFRLEEQADGAIGMRLRSSSLPPEQGKPQHRRTSSYDRLHELADWRRCGVHSEYADAALVGSRGEIPIHHLRTLPYRLEYGGTTHAADDGDGAAA